MARRLHLTFFVGQTRTCSADGNGSPSAPSTRESRRVPRSPEGGEPKRLTWQRRPTPSRADARRRRRLPPRATVVPTAASLLDAPAKRRRRDAHGFAPRPPGPHLRGGRQPHRVSRQQTRGMTSGATTAAARDWPHLDRGPEDLPDLVTPPWTDSVRHRSSRVGGDSVYFLSDRDGVSNDAVVRLSGSGKLARDHEVHRRTTT